MSASQSTRICFECHYYTRQNSKKYCGVAGDFNAPECSWYQEKNEDLIYRPQPISRYLYDYPKGGSEQAPRWMRKLGSIHHYSRGHSRQGRDRVVSETLVIDGSHPAGFTWTFSVGIKGGKEVLEIVDEQDKHRIIKHRDYSYNYILITREYKENIREAWLKKRK